MPEKNPFEPAITLPANWVTKLDENGHPVLKVPHAGEFGLKNADDREVVLALIAEYLNGKGQYKRGREQLFLQLLIAQAYREGEEEPAGPLDPYEQDSLTLAIYLMISAEESKTFKGNTHELRKKLIDKAEAEKLTTAWWPTALNWFSKKVEERIKRLEKVGIIAKKLSDETRSWDISVKEKNHERN